MALSSPHTNNQGEPKLKVALNTYSLRNEWAMLTMKGLDPVFKICKDAKVDEVELLDRHFEKGALAASVKQFANNGINVFAIGPHVHLLAKKEEVPKMIAEGKSYLGEAHGAGVKLIRFQVADGPLARAFAPMPDFDEEEMAEYEESIQEAIDLSAPVVDPLLEEAEKLGVCIGIETHHSYSSNYIYMKLFNKRWPSKNIGWIFDIGNYENDHMRWEALNVIKKNTVYVHAKAYDFDAKGFEKKLDFPKAAKILHEAGFNGNWSVEFEGKMNGVLGFFKTSELCRYSIAAATGGSYTMKTGFPDEDELMDTYMP